MSSSEQGAGQQPPESEPGTAVQGDARAIGDLLTRPADEFVNDPNIEMAWMSSAVQHMEAHYKLLTAAQDSTDIRLTPNDQQIYERFREQFPDLKVAQLTEQDIKSEPAKAEWRKFCNDMQDKVEDFNFATLMRLDCRQDYNEPNTIVVPRAQFLAIEVARNREGLNSGLVPSPADTDQSAP